MTSTLLESYDALAFTAVVEERLTAAVARLGKARALTEEKAWLQAAVEKLAAARGPHLELLQRVVRLPELEAVRAEHALELQNLAVDAVERLQAGITFHAGSRSPLLDSLFVKLKFAALRRAEAAEFEKFCVDFEKRLTTQYAKRQLSTPAFEFAAPVLEQVRAAFATWRGAFNPEPLLPADAQVLEQALRTAAQEVELPLRQIRLLCEAALAPVPGAFEESGLGGRPKKRSIRKIEEPIAEPPAPEPEPAVTKKSKKRAAAKSGAEAASPAPQ
jgi:hypothetical protein